MYEDLPEMSSHALCQIFCDELSAVLQLIERMGSPELQEAAKARMFSLPERVRQAQAGEDRPPNLN